MELFLMRHGEARPLESAAQEDSRRSLSPAGVVQVERVAEGLKRQHINLAAIVSSPLVRTCQTAEILGRILGVHALRTLPALAPGNDFKKILMMLCSEKQYPLMLVSHHPDLTALVSILTNTDPLVCPQFQTASVAALTWDPKNQTGQQRWFQTAEQLSHP